jgi:hypothetical protein
VLTDIFIPLFSGFQLILSIGGALLIELNSDKYSLPDRVFICNRYFWLTLSTIESEVYVPFPLSVTLNEELSSPLILTCALSSGFWFALTSIGVVLLNLIVVAPLAFINPSTTR